MGCHYKSNAHKIDFLFPLSDGRTIIQFEVSFEKGRKKRDMGLYRVRFGIPESDLGKLQEHDIDFLTAGFLKLIEQFAAKVENPLYSLDAIAEMMDRSSSLSSASLQ